MRSFPPCQRRQREAARERSEESDKGHGRPETRTIETTTDLNHFLRQQLGWSSVRQVFRITRVRITPDPETGEPQRSTEVAYGITSLPRDQADAKQLPAYNRGHRGIENRLHYVRDQTFGEDASRIRKGTAHGRWPPRGTRPSRCVDGTTPPTSPPVDKILTGTPNAPSRCRAL